MARFRSMVKPKVGDRGGDGRELTKGEKDDTTGMPTFLKHHRQQKSFLEVTEVQTAHKSALKWKLQNLLLK